MNRISKDEYHLGIAKAICRRSTCLRRQYGAVVENDVIIATGYNGSPRGAVNCCDTGICHRTGHAHNDGNYSTCPAVHAEMNAIISCEREKMIGSTLYLYGEENGTILDAEPCPVCRNMIANSGIEYIVAYKNGTPTRTKVSR